MDNKHADLVLGKVLLKFKTAVDSHENIKLLLREDQERPILQAIPALLVNRGGLVIDEE
jgi:hypothetical protein